jgi:hypothetical protein
VPPPSPAQEPERRRRGLVHRSPSRPASAPPITDV